MIRNHYQTLGLERSATEEEVKKAYRLYASKFHPDKHEGDKFFEERFQEIQTAYEVLINENKRLLYDNEYLTQFAKTTQTAQQRQKQNETPPKTNLQPIIEVFESSHDTVKSGDKVVLRWVVHNADMIKLSDFGDVEPVGKKTIFIRDMYDNDFLIITLGAANSQINKMVTKTLKLRRYGSKVEEENEEEETEDDGINSRKIYLYLILFILVAWLVLYIINYWSSS